MIRLFIGFCVPLFFVANLAFIFYQVWIIITFDTRSENVSGRTLHHIEFPPEDEIEKMNAVHFFGHPQVVKSGGKGQGYKVSEWEINGELIDNAPETRTSGKVTGLLLSDNARKSLVIIEHAGKQTGYGIGERLVGSNTVIVRILKNKILLDENGYYTTLSFNE